MDSKQHPHTLVRSIEALLFAAGEQLSIEKLAALTQADKHDVVHAIDSLQQTLRGRGISLLQKDEVVSLGTAPDLGPLVEKFIKEEFFGELSRASLETLTIIAYRNPIGRADIDYIRGVNSSFTIRNLLTRGLIERVSVPRATDGRGWNYRPTIAFMKFLGITAYENLPDYEATKKEFEQALSNDMRTNE